MNDLPESFVWSNGFNFYKTKQAAYYYNKISFLNTNYSGMILEYDYITGRLEYSCEYENGNKHGCEIEYYVDDDKIKYKRMYEHGKLQDCIQKFELDGSIMEYYIHPITEHICQIIQTDENIPHLFTDSEIKVWWRKNTLSLQKILNERLLELQERDNCPYFLGNEIIVSDDEKQYDLQNGYGRICKKISIGLHFLKFLKKKSRRVTKKLI